MNAFKRADHNDFADAIIEIIGKCTSIMFVEGEDFTYKLKN